MRKLMTLSCLLLFPALQSFQPVVAQEPVCSFGTVDILADFPNARVDGCKQREDGTIVIKTEPEDYPINPSPWYAFQVQSDDTQEVALEVLALQDGMARYNPKSSHDRRQWNDIPHDKSDHAIYFEVTAGPDPLYIAGQELINNRDYIRWLGELTEQSPLQLFNIGTSAQKRPMPAAVHYGDSDEWLLVIGRQHPPEVPGAIALKRFVEEVFAGHVLGESFLARYNVLVVPNMNPDGVQLGNWRHSTGGVDLNRDWFERSQPEVAAVHQYLEEQVAAGADVVYGLDFHSTWRNVYYTMPVDYLEREPTFSQDWLTALADTIPYEVEESPSTSELGIFKQYMADVHGVHSVTYEVGDETDRKEVHETASAAARVLMEYMLERPMSE